MAFDAIATSVTRGVGSPWAFVTAILIIVVWATVGPLFGFSEVWQLVINTATTIITFLMVFVIQYSANKDTAALHLKLDELITKLKGPRNKIAGIEKKLPK